MHYILKFCDFFNIMATLTTIKALLAFGFWNPIGQGGRDKTLSVEALVRIKVVFISMLGMHWNVFIFKSDLWRRDWGSKSPEVRLRRGCVVGVSGEFAVNPPVPKHPKLSQNVPMPITCTGLMRLWLIHPKWNYMGLLRTPSWSLVILGDPGDIVVGRFGQGSGTKL